MNNNWFKGINGYYRLDDVDHFEIESYDAACGNYKWVIIAFFKDGRKANVNLLQNYSDSLKHMRDILNITN